MAVLRLLEAEDRYGICQDIITYVIFRRAGGRAYLLSQITMKPVREYSFNLSAVMPRDGVRLWTEGAQPHRAISLSSLVELRLYGIPRASGDESIKGGGGYIPNFDVEKICLPSYLLSTGPMRVATFLP